MLYIKLYVLTLSNKTAAFCIIPLNYLWNFHQFRPRIEEVVSNLIAIIGIYKNTIYFEVIFFKLNTHSNEPRAEIVSILWFASFFITKINGRSHLQRNLLQISEAFRKILLTINLKKNNSLELCTEQKNHPKDSRNIV